MTDVALRVLVTGAAGFIGQKGYPKRFAHAARRCTG